MKKGRAALRRLTLAAMLIAMSVVIGIFCKSVLNFANGMARITFENLPIILGGILLGPVYGGAIGLASDLLSYLLSGQAYAPIPLVTLGAVLVGVCAGLVSRFVVKEHGSKQTILAGAAAHLVGSMIVKPIGLFSIYGWAVLLRIPIYLAIAPIEILLICLLFKNRGFKKIAEGIGHDLR